jgi:hypothetical protein
VPTFSVSLGVFDVVDPGIAHASHATQPGVDVVGCKPNRHAAGLRRFRLDRHMREAGEDTIVGNVIFAPKSSHDIDRLFAHLDARARIEP